MFNNWLFVVRRAALVVRGVVKALSVACHSQLPLESSNLLSYICELIWNLQCEFVYKTDRWRVECALGYDCRAEGECNFFMYLTKSAARRTINSLICLTPVHRALRQLCLIFTSLVYDEIIIL